MKFIIRLIHLFYFVPYAISPLVFPVCPKHTPDGYISESAHVLILDVIARDMIGKGEEPRNHQNQSVLIRKKRALLPETYSAKLLFAGDTAGVKDIPFPLPEWISCNNSGKVLPGTPKGFHSLLAGHSPPPA